MTTLRAEAIDARAGAKTLIAGVSLAVWPGEKPGPQFASLQKPPQPDPAGVFPDGEDPPEPPHPSLLLNDLNDRTDAAAPESAHSSPGGGRSHASF